MPALLRSTKLHLLNILQMVVTDEVSNYYFTLAANIVHVLNWGLSFCAITNSTQATPSCYMFIESKQPIVCTSSKLIGRYTNWALCGVEEFQYAMYYELQMVASL